MSLAHAIVLTQMLLALTILQQSMEHLRKEPQLSATRIALCLLLLTGFAAPWVCLALVIHALFILRRFDGPYNGGSDRMTLLILCCLCAALFMPGLRGRELIFGYLALQLVLSYFIAGWVKITNPDWRSGRALRDVLQFSAYPVSESVRLWADRPALIRLASWAVILFELLFPFTLLSHATLTFGLIIAALFHLTNACLFGLNRFFWIWLAAYPSLLWLQERLFTGV